MVIYVAVLGPILLGLIGESLYHRAPSEPARTAKAWFTCLAVTSLGLNILLAAETDDWWWPGGINLLAYIIAFVMAMRAHSQHPSEELTASTR